MARTLIVTLMDDLPMESAITLFDGVRGIVAIGEGTEQRLENELHRVRAQRQRAKAEQGQPN